MKRIIRNLLLIAFSACLMAAVGLFVAACGPDEEHTTHIDENNDGICDVCNEPMSQHTEHDWGEWTVSTPSTCKEVGTEIRACKGCTEKEVRPLPLADHVDANNDETCDVCGADLSIGEHEHQWGAWTVDEVSTCTKQGSHSHTCSVCKKTETEKLPYADHVWESGYTVDKEATETEDGQRSVHCKNCGTSDPDRTEVIPKLDPNRLVEYTFRLTRNNGMPLSGSVYAILTITDESGNPAIGSNGKPKGAITMTASQYKTELRAGNYNVDIQLATPLNFTVNEGKYTVTASAPEVDVYVTPQFATSEASSYPVGSVIYDYTFTSVKDGSTVTLSELGKQYDIIYLNFFYVGCTWCEQELPPILSAYPKYKDKMVIIFLNIYEPTYDTDENIMKWVKDEITGRGRYDISSFFIGRGASLFNKIYPSNVPATDRGVPFSAFIDKEGVVLNLHQGAVGEMVGGSFQCTTKAAYELFNEVFAAVGLPTVTYAASVQLPAVLPSKREN